jgi:hypothetical protein
MVEVRTSASAMSQGGTIDCTIALKAVSAENSGRSLTSRFRVKLGMIRPPKEEGHTDPVAKVGRRCDAQRIELDQQCSRSRFWVLWRAAVGSCRSSEANDRIPLLQTRWAVRPSVVAHGGGVLPAAASSEDTGGPRRQ